MTDQGSSNVGDTAKVVKGIVEAVPVYQDLAQPAVQEAGKGLQTVAKTVLIALAPLKALVWSYEQFEDFLSKNVAKKLSNTPADEITTPKLNVAGPALEALRFTGHEETLRELYANLLAASMDVKTASMAHPSFVEVIKQLTPDEARLLRFFTSDDLLPMIDVRAELEDGSGGVDVLVDFSVLGEKAGCEHPHLTPSYVNNLSRLGIIQVPEKFYTAPGAYDELENHPSVVELKDQISNMEGRKVEVRRRIVEITTLGNQFVKACVVDHRES